MIKYKGHLNISQPAGCLRNLQFRFDGSYITAFTACMRNFPVIYIFRIKTPKQKLVLTAPAGLIRIKNSREYVDTNFYQIKCRFLNRYMK